MESFYFYIYCIVALIVGLWLVKRFVSCLVRTAITVIILAILILIYFNYFA